MARLLMCSVVIALGATAAASPAPIIHVARTSAVTSAHVSRLTASLASHPLPPGVTLDVSVVTMSATPRGATLRIAAEVRGALSDKHGHIRAVSTVRVSVTGRTSERVLLEKDLLDEAARRLARTLASSSPS